jgi:integrase
VALHDALERAVRWRLLSVNPCDAVGQVKVPRSQPRALDAEEAASLVELLRGHEFERIFRLALGAGMRPGEYTALRWEDIDLERKAVDRPAGHLAADSQRCAGGRGKESSE